MQFVYGLADPITGAIRYIGMTNDPQTRYRAHCRESDDRDPKSLWIKDLRKSKLLPSLLIIEQVENDDMIREREKYWIQFHIDRGACLTNILVPHKVLEPRPPVSHSKAHGPVKVSANSKISISASRQPSKELMSEALIEAFNRKASQGIGYTLSQLAKDTGIHYTYLHRIMHGKSLPSWDKLLKVCKSLECSFRELDEIFEYALYRTPTAKEFEEGRRAA